MPLIETSPNQHTNSLIEHPAVSNRIQLLLQTAFEGFGANSFEQAKQVAVRYGLKIPVGHSGTAQEPSLLMRRYRTGGTPWTVIIVKLVGPVRFELTTF